MPKRLLTTSLVLILIGLLPLILSRLGVQQGSATRLLDLFPVPRHIRELIDDFFSFEAITFVGVVLLAIAAYYVIRRLMEVHSQNAPMSTSDVLLAEVKAIHGKDPDPSLKDGIAAFFRQPEPKPDEAQVQGRDAISNVSPGLYRWLNGIDRTALCLSGGGIRSASFALGVLQALATHPRTRDGAATVSSPEKSLLSKFHYLSTVSGGGYIGSWFSSWVQRIGYPSVWRDLVRLPSREQDPGEQAAPLRWLRVHSNFLAPKLGLSGDILAGVAIVLRNLFLNWLVLLPVLCAVLIAMKLMALEVFRLWVDPNGWSLVSVGSTLLVWLVLLVSALSFLLRNRPTRTYDEKTQASHTAFLIWGLLPSIVAAISFTLFLALNVVLLDYFQEQAKGAAAPGVFKTLLAGLFGTLKQPSSFSFIAAAFIGAGIYALSYVISWIRSWPKLLGKGWNRTQELLTSKPREPREAREAISGNFWRWTLSGAIYGALVMVITYVFVNQSEIIERMIFVRFSDLLDPAAASAKLDASMPRRLLALIYLGVPLMLLAQLIAEMIFVGLTSEEPHSEEDREWLGRAAGLCLLVGVAWLIVMHMAYIGTDITMRAGEYFHNHPLQTLVMIVVLYVVGGIAAAIGRSGRTPAHRSTDMGAKAKTASATLSIVAVVLLVVVVVGVSALIDYLILGRSLADYADLKPYNGDADARAVAIATARYNFWFALAVVAVIGSLSSTSINVNRFSMHALYRNRLIRMFLGASNQKRRPNPFTDFDRKDNLPMHETWPSKHTWKGDLSGERSWRPFHVVNIALNVSSSDDHLEWQERKACSFTVSPLHSGSSVTGFRDTEAYGDGISLGTAVAISGACASPNQGYNSSTPLAFLMALFNVRLGWWLGNPGKSGEVTHTYDGPRNALVPFLAEMLGMTSDTNKYVYLSDGGHFENLALYEMVRRRCRFIVLSDAGCDPDYAFEDLGNAVRKIEIDMGVPIHFHGLSKLKPRHSPDRLDDLLGRQAPPPASAGNPQPYHAIGLIDYRAADGPDARDGIVLYIKPGYHGTESSAAVRSYAIANPAFPHEATSDQFFGESQMESYRALGFEIMDNLLRDALDDLKDTADPTLPNILTVLARDSSRARRTLPAPLPIRPVDQVAS